MREREWLIVLCMTAILIGLSIKSFKNPESSWPHHFGKPVAVPQKMIVLNIRGAVKKPGRYQLPVGSRLRDLVLLAEPEENADISRLDSEKELKKGQRIYIPSKKEKKRKR